MPAVRAITRIRIVNIFSRNHLAHILKPDHVRCCHNQGPSRLQHSFNFSKRVNGILQQVLENLTEENYVKHLITVGKLVLFDIEMLVTEINNFARLPNGNFLVTFGFLTRFKEVCQVELRLPELLQQGRGEVRIRAEFKDAETVFLRNEAQGVDESFEVVVRIIP